MEFLNHKINRKKDKFGIPLSEKMRPETLDDFVGQNHIMGKSAVLHKAIKEDKIFSMILWGPPGCGKTSLANIIANKTKSEFIQISAVLSGVKEIRSVIENARKSLYNFRKKTIFFVDEIHRFSKSQQDAFLKHVENGLITLIGATTQNPSYEIIPALLSRCRVFTFNSHSKKEIVKIVNRAVSDKVNGLGTFNLEFEPDALSYIIKTSDGDVRTALNSLELTVFYINKQCEHKEDKKKVTLDDIEEIFQKKVLLYDKSGEEHYNLISAFHKSLRGSDPDAAIYWIARMLLAGEDPLYIARRMVRFASEDIGVADNNALSVALNAMEAYRFLGYPEGEGALVQAAVYLSTAPKSNSIYKAYNKAKEVVDETGTLPVPCHIRNASTKLMKNLGYGEGYKYAHNYKGAYVPQDYLPEKIQNHEFYNPSDRGYEKVIKQRLDAWKGLKKSIKNHSL